MAVSKLKINLLIQVEAAFCRCVGVVLKGDGFETGLQRFRNRDLEREYGEAGNSEWTFNLLGVIAHAFV
ncbi:hypothetical protein D5066_19505 [Enterobacter chuandaensis]|nr:hypothetical protein D5066_19505 [Enterobacter chuandaensis]